MTPDQAYAIVGRVLSKWAELKSEIDTLSPISRMTIQEYQDAEATHGADLQPIDRVGFALAQMQSEMERNFNIRMTRPLRDFDAYRANQGGDDDLESSDTSE